MHIAYIGIGSNLGKREHNCDRAIALMSAKGLKTIKTSAMIESEPWGVTNQRAFINSALCIETELPPEKLLSALKEIESLMGRTETFKWGPRIIDLDILFYDNLILETDELSIPHPYIKDRDFVLVPLVEIAPDLIHPVFKKSMKELLKELTGK